MPFLRWFAREGFRTLKYVFRGIFRSLLRYVPCTMHPPLFSHPLRVNGMAGVSLAPMPPRHCAENGRCAVCSTPASSGGPGRTPPLSRPALWPPYSSHLWDSPSGATLTLFKNAPGVFTLKTGPGCAPAFSSRGRHVAISLQKVFQRRNGQHGISKKNAGHLSVTRISPQATF